MFHRLPRTTSFRVALFGFAAASSFLTACDVTAFAAGSTIGVFTRAAPALQRLEDPYLVEEALPGSLSTLEGLLSIHPNNADLRLTLARSYCSYGFGFMEERMEAATEVGDEARAEEFRERASLAYKRARAIALETLFSAQPREGGIDALKREGIEAFTAWIGRFQDAGAGPHIFWGAYAWARYISNHTDDPDALADLAFVSAMADRAKALSPEYESYAPLALVAGLKAATPAQLGGQPERAKEGFDDVIQKTGRRNFMFIVLEAKLVAVALQDRAAYVGALREVICGDANGDPNNRLQNILAQRRARRYLAQVDQFFDAEGAETPDPTNPDFCLEAPVQGVIAEESAESAEAAEETVSGEE